MEAAILELRNITKQYGNSIILDQINLVLRPGRIHALLGENGTGKSTLAELICGSVSADSGQLYYKGSLLTGHSPQKARQLGIGMLHQTTQFYPHLTVAENLFIHTPGDSQMPLSLRRKKRWEKQAAELLARFHLNLSPALRAGKLNHAQQRVVEILRLFSQGSELLIFDEPTCFFTADETKIFYELLKEQAAAGTAVLLISHELDHIIQYADSLSILQDGQLRAFENSHSPDEIYKLMSVSPQKGYPNLRITPGRTLFRAEHISLGQVLQELSLYVREGEIVGITGSISSGKALLGEVLCGIRPPQSGAFYLYEKPLSFHSPRDAIRSGICYIAGNQARCGLFQSLNLEENIIVTDFEQVRTGLFLDRKKTFRTTQHYISRLRIRVQNPKLKVAHLSGGNQQKVVLAKWFYTKARLFILEEPTGGIDAAGKVDIYNILNSLKSNGAGIILISADGRELLGICDRLYKLDSGKIVRELDCRNSRASGVRFS